MVYNATANTHKHNLCYKETKQQTRPHIKTEPHTQTQSVLLQKKTKIQPSNLKLSSMKQIEDADFQFFNRRKTINEACLRDRNKRL